MQICDPAHNTKTRLTGRLRDERGQVLVEFALVLPVLILFIMGIIYFGRYMDYNNQLTQLTEEGARWASVDSNPSSTGQTLQNYIKSQAQPELQFGSSDVSAVQVFVYYPSSSTGNTVGQSLRVCAVSTVKFPFLGITGTTATMAQSATMRIEVADATAFTATAIGSVPSGCPTT
jgi:Flp pilus assembly protein TadG